VIPHIQAHDLSSAIGVLSAMITPTVMILACGSLIMTTSSRLVRAVDRTREMLPAFEELAKKENFDTIDAQKQSHMFDQLARLTTRSRLLQLSLMQLYGALALFLGTSVAIGVQSLFMIESAWTPLALGFLGAALLLAASVMLMVESRIALKANFAEMDYIWRITQAHAPESHRTRDPRFWGLFR
jgi:hypothetical protein